MTSTEEVAVRTFMRRRTRGRGGRPDLPMQQIPDKRIAWLHGVPAEEAPQLQESDIALEHGLGPVLLDGCARR